MPLLRFEGTAPTVAPSCSLVGDVRVEADASVGYGAVPRADFGPIIIRAGANIQDNSVPHGGSDPLVVGPGTTVGHLRVVHIRVIGTEAVIGNGATVQDGARIGDRALVGTGSLVPPNVVIGDGLLVLGAPTTVRGPLTESASWWVQGGPAVYRELAARHRDTVSSVVEADQR